MTTRRTPARLALGALLTSLTVAGSTAIAAPAQAAWGTQTTIHDARAQVCKVRLAGGDFKIKLRLDNRKADHAHLGMLFRDRDGRTTTRKARAAAGKVSKVKSLRWKRGDSLTTGVHEIKGPGAGGGTSIGAIPIC